jgi:hypothetical protein
MFAEALEARRAAAAEEAVQLTNAIADSTYDPASDTFYQGTLQEEAVPAAAEPPKQPKQPKQVGGSGQGGEVGGPPPPPPVSPLLWKPERVVADLKLARKLMVVLDAERGLTANPLLEADLMAAAAAADAAAAAEGEEGAAGAGKDEAAAGEAVACSRHSQSIESAWWLHVCRPLFTCIVVQLHTWSRHCRSSCRSCACAARFSVRQACVRGACWGWNDCEKTACCYHSMAAPF